MSEVPAYLDKEHLENLYLQMKDANDKNMAEKFKLQAENADLKRQVDQIKCQLKGAEECCDDFVEAGKLLVKCVECKQEVTTNMTEAHNCSQHKIVGGDIQEFGVVEYVCFKCSLTEDLTTTKQALQDAVNILTNTLDRSYRIDKSTHRVHEDELLAIQEFLSKNGRDKKEL